MNMVSLTASWQNQQNGMCAQWRLRSAWAPTKSDQSLCCLHEESLGPHLPIEHTAKTLIPRLIWVFARRTCYFVGFVTRRLIQASLWENVSSGVSDQVRLKLACSATETSMRLETLVTECRNITLSRQRTTKVLIRLHGCAGWSAPLLFVYDIKHFLWHSSYVFTDHTSCKNTGWNGCCLSLSLISHLQLNLNNMIHVMRKPVYAICEQQRLVGCVEA